MVDAVQRDFIKTGERQLLADQCSIRKYFFFSCFAPQAGDGPQGNIKTAAALLKAVLRLQHYIKQGAGAHKRLPAAGTYTKPVEFTAVNIIAENIYKIIYQCKAMLCCMVGPGAVISIKNNGKWRTHFGLCKREPLQLCMAGKKGK